MSYEVSVGYVVGFDDGLIDKILVGVKNGVKVGLVDVSIIGKLVGDNDGRKLGTFDGNIDNTLEGVIVVKIKLDGTKVGISLGDTEVASIILGLVVGINDWKSG